MRQANGLDVKYEQKTPTLCYSQYGKPIKTINMISIAYCIESLCLGLYIELMDAE